MVKIWSVEPEIEMIVMVEVVSGELGEDSDKKCVTALDNDCR